jgi:hypothetical protein
MHHRIEIGQMQERDRSRRWRLSRTAILAWTAVIATNAAVGAAPARLERLVAAYPQHLAGIDGNWLTWRDGSRMPIDDGRGKKDFAAWLANPDVEDMLAIPYPVGAAIAAPAVNSDPGRARNSAFFDKMYGDCRSGEVERHLVDVIWLPASARQRIRVTRINGVAERLAQISRALEALPAAYMRYLAPAAGGYHCRPIAGTDRGSPHGYGIAIDIAIRHADYWRWAPKAGGRPFRNRIPAEIIQIFEAHGFIWGGRWFHYDTMHFEYRPELAPPVGR